MLFIRKIIWIIFENSIVHDAYAARKETAHDAIQTPCNELHPIAAKGNAAPKMNLKYINHYFILTREVPEVFTRFRAHTLITSRPQYD